MRPPTVIAFSTMFVLRVSRQASMSFHAAILVAFACFSSGCISVVPQSAKVDAVDAAPPNPAMVASCQSTLRWHNNWVLLGTAFGGIAGAGGLTDIASQNKSWQTGIDIGVIAAGVLAGVATTAAGLEASTYAQEDCAQVLGQAAGAAERTKVSGR